MKTWALRLFVATAVLLLLWLAYNNHRAGRAMVDVETYQQANKKLAEYAQKQKARADEIEQIMERTSKDRERLAEQMALLKRKLNNRGKQHAEQNGCDCSNSIVPADADCMRWPDSVPSSCR